MKNAGIAAGGWRPYTGRRVCAGAVSLGGAYAKPKTKSRKAVSRSLRLLTILFYNVFAGNTMKLSEEQLKFKAIQEWPFDGSDRYDARRDAVNWKFQQLISLKCSARKELLSVCRSRCR